MADISTEIKNFQEAVYGEAVRGSMVSLAQKVNDESTKAATSANESARDAATAISTASVAAEQCNSSASNANAKALLADKAAQTATETATAVQTKLDKGDFVGPQGAQGEKGEPFQIAKVYVSVSEMNAGYDTDDVKTGQFVIINTGDVGNEDNAKLYLKGTSGYDFMTDLSGAQGVQGPQGVRGIQGMKGEQGLKGDKGDTGGVENLEIQPLHYVEPADPAEGQQEQIPESGNPLGGIVGWLIKKAKKAATSISGLTSAQTAINTTISNLSNRCDTLHSDMLYTQANGLDGGQTFGGDFLLMNPTDPGSVWHQASFFGVEPGNVGWVNVPPGIDRNQSWVGIRYVLWRNEYHIMVELHEMYPVTGRLWFNFYNYGAWMGWRYITPQA